MDWKKRLTNKTFLLSITGCVVAFIYQILGIIGVIPPVGQDQITQLIGLFINILLALGIVIDPTTSGIKDSKKEDVE